MRFKKSILYPSSILLGAMLLAGSTLFNACKSSTKPADVDHFKATGDTIADGKALVNMYCTKCHKLVEADQLTKDVWKFHALPSMSVLLGISNYGNVGYFKHNPDSAGISLVNWQIVQAYYNKVAPDSLKPAKPPVAATTGFAGFTIKKPEAKSAIEVTTSLIAADSANNKIYTADAITNALTEWDAALKPTAIATTPSPAVGVSFYKDATGAQQALLSCIGEMQPMSFPNGKVIGVNLGDARHAQTLVGSELMRPVQTVAGDFNKDGLNDWAILGAGGEKGAVYIMTQKSDHTYSQSTAIDKAGAVAAVTGDFNNDGWTDLMVLFGSTDEGLWLLLNDHKGGFTAKNLLRFPPVYGSTSFQLADINHDGKLDVIYTCGYNFRDSRIMKPYHGLYIFLNQGDWDLKQSWFYPINGCTKAVAADFDHDGDLDIITTAFFADLQHNPAEQVMYFEQDKQMGFRPHSIPVSKLGRFFSMDVADINHDGKPDVLLGNYSRGFVIQSQLVPFWDKQTPFVILQNNMGK